MAHYYYLLASVPEARQEHESHKWDLGELLDFILDNLTEKDKKPFWYLLYPNDNQNLLAAMARRHRRPRPLLHRAVPAAIPKEIIDNYHQHTEELPAYMQDFLESVGDKESEYTYAELERPLLEHFFAAAENTGSKLINGYYALEKQLRNLAAAFAAREAGLDREPHLLPDEELGPALKRSQAPDFGLGQVYPAAKLLAEAYDKKDPLRMDRLLEDIRWQWLEEQTLFHHYDQEAVYAYYLKLSLLHRRHRYDPKKGRERLDRMIASKLEKLEIDRIKP